MSEILEGFQLTGFNPLNFAESPFVKLPEFVDEKIIYKIYSGKNFRSEIWVHNKYEEKKSG